MRSRKLFLVILLLFLFQNPLDLYGQEKQIKEIYEYNYEVKYHQIENGQELAYIDVGEGKPLILIHGLGSYLPAWRQNIDALSQNYRVIALDLPGYGKSSKKVENFTIPFFAQSVAQLQDALNIKQSTWMGHSMGGQIAMEGAASYPNKISRLVLIAPAGFEKFAPQEGAMMQQFVTPESIKSTSESAVRSTFQTTFYDFPQAASFMADDRVAIRSATNFDAYARAYAGSIGAMIEGPVFEKLSSITQPTLIIFGAQDALIPNRQLHPNATPRTVAESGAAELPNSELMMIEKAGHFVQFEQAEKVNKGIMKFLKSN
jgi:pimeloyl-ACP methyl ester carboxylesterase